MKTMTLELDDLDYDAVQTAIARRQALGIWPSTGEDYEGHPLADGSNIAGLAVAEICRGWMEMLDIARQRDRD